MQPNDFWFESLYCKCWVSKMLKNIWILPVSSVVLLAAKLCHHNPRWFLNCLSNCVTWLAGLCPLWCSLPAMCVFPAPFHRCSVTWGAQTTTNTVCASCSSWGDFHLSYIKPSLEKKLSDSPKKRFNSFEFTTVLLVMKWPSDLILNSNFILKCFGFIVSIFKKFLEIQLKTLKMPL